MVKRISWKKYSFTAFALILLLMSWDSNKSSAAVIESAIPKDSIRVRIIANSDSIPDQAVKRVVRDRVVQEMDSWVADPQDIEGARQELRAHLSELDSLVGHVLEDRGFAYGQRVELATVPFPEKIYGGRVYPAGQYEALRITLGSGQGQNWWCVLFPPLCFADAVSKKIDKDSAVAEAASYKEAAAANSGEQLEDGKIEVHFLVWDLVKSGAGHIKRWLA